MRFISTRMHGILDYTMGLLLVASPWVFNFPDGGPAQWVPVILGFAAILYSLLTRYEYGLFRLIPMPGHLLLDFASGTFLAISPWLFGFSHVVYLPHLILGVLEVGAALSTKTVPDTASTVTGDSRFDRPSYT